ncbi:MAG: hypothetical protein R2828_09450 [Saprospiraceae bacterium]
MTNLVPIQIVDSKKRIVFQIPDFIEFGEILHDRLHAILYHIEELEGKFMLITNIFDREPERLEQLEKEKKEDLEALIYAGTVRQREILERDKPQYLIKKLKKEGNKWDIDQWRKERDENWAELKFRPLTRDMEKVETFEFFDNFRQGTLDETAVKIGTLKDYFANLDNILQVNEYPIVSDYFDINKDKYIGIPLLGMGLFQGIVWVLFPNALTSKLENPATTRRIMKLFQMEYDNLAMSWDIKGENITRASLFEQAVKELNPDNDIQNYINIAKYYEISKFYHQERVKQNDAVLERVKELLERIKNQHVRTAIITILLDSYAHNISAHSLTTLSYWFRERSEYQHKEGKAMIETLGRDNNPIITYTRDFPERTLSKELFPLFKFLLEKGAFWSGITRQTNFTGKVSSLYNVLWFDFANNPLYLGTIANTEEVRKLHVNITIFEREDRKAGETFKNIKTVKRTKEGKLLDGTFAIVNLDDFSNNAHLKAKQDSPFVEKGELFEELSQELRTFRAFFPGGVIGKHAFFTLLENEIRNVKHYKGEILREIQEKGLTLNISIHNRPIDSEAEEQNPEPELYKIGVWLKHPVQIKENLLVRRIEGLDSDIVTEDTFLPKLGGNFQDKICGSVLMMSAFDKVQSKDSAIGRIYYPWIKTASYLIRDDKNAFEEFEVSHRKYRDADRLKFSETFASEAGSGYLKKYFHIWRGAEILDLGEDKSLIKNNELDNRPRYKFIYLPLNQQNKLNALKESGLIRIVSSEQKPKSIEEGYRIWLASWLKKGKENYVIDFLEGGTRVGRITYGDGDIRFENESQVADADLDDNCYEIYKAIPNRMQIAIEHGSALTAASNKFNYRSHGELIAKFCQGMPMNHLNGMPADDCFELFEALASKVCIFDRRIYNRLYTGHPSATKDKKHQLNPQKLALQLARLDLYRQHLHLNFQNELIEHFEAVKEEGFLNFHFLVLHLSFIEGMENATGDKYGEEGIIDFINDHILQGVKPEAVGNDFVLIITTGRGRMAWWDKIKENPAYARFTTFRPIESILGAVEDALEKPDDIDLKYNLTKLFFGS